MTEASTKQQDGATFLESAIADESERSSSSSNFSENDSDLENKIKNRTNGKTQQDRALGENVLGASQRVNYESHNGGGSKGTSTAKPMAFLVEKQKGTEINERDNDIESSQTATQEDLLGLFSASSEVNDNEERYSESETDSNEALSPTSSLDFAESNTASESEGELEEEYKKECNEYLLELTDTTTADFVQCREQNTDESTLEVYKQEEVANDNTVHHMESNDTLYNMDNAPSDGRAYLFEKAKKEQNPGSKVGSKCDANTGAQSSDGVQERSVKGTGAGSSDKEEAKATNTFGRRSSFGSRYKNGLISGLSLESKSGAFPKPNVEKPHKPVGLQQMRSPESTVSTCMLTSPRTSSPKGNTRNLLKMYNKDLYYANELNYLLNIDPAERPTNGEIKLDEIEKIVEECPGVCRARYDFTVNGETIKLYPLFMLVAHAAPLELVEIVFAANPFMFLTEVDPHGQTIMHYALRFNPPSIKTLNYLIHRSPHSLDAWDNAKRSPLHTACAHLSWATQVVQFVVNETPKHVLATPDNEGNLPMHLALNSMECSYALIKNLTDRYPEALASRTAKDDLPIELAQKWTLQDDIQGYILSHTPEKEVSQDYLPVALRMAKCSASLRVIQHLVEENPAVLTRTVDDKLPIEIAHSNDASKVVMRYLYEKTPKNKIPKWMVKLRPTEREVREALKKESENENDCDQSIPARNGESAKDDAANFNCAGTKRRAADNSAQVILPKPSFWDMLCCKPRIVLE